MARNKGGKHSRTGSLTRSPLAKGRFPQIPEVPGVQLSAVAAGVRYRGRKDVMLAELSPGTTVGGVFTRSRTAAAPVVWCRDRLKAGRARAVLVNAGNANAFTGSEGVSTVAAVATTLSLGVGALAQDAPTVTIIAHENPGDAELFERIEAGMAEAGTPVNIEVIALPSSGYADALSLRLLSGEVPDIIYFQGADAEFANQGILEDA